MVAVNAGAFVELLVPLARGADYTDAVAALREARELLRQGNIEPAIVEARARLWSRSVSRAARRRCLPRR
ncbi:hypothetical protein GCM10023176_54320 [Micromonospora coerulea]|uniref:Uncharacterized protein n=1 Tax=Micromonospora coerulea TaxID=47856 RepID=A0ABP8T2E4_9ACTN